MQGPEDNAFGNIAIVGGGTAGYLAALTLRAFHPKAKLTLIESSRIPIIGVGESTTSEIVPFLHKVLNLDIEEFYLKVIPTWKLGIKFIWGPLEKGYFNYPFDRGPILEAQIYEGHIRNFSLSAALMSTDRSLLLAAADTHVSLLCEQPFGYHLDNRRFVRYLTEKAAERGIEILDLEIVDGVLAPDGESIDHLVTSDGCKLSYDFYVDCTGFRSLLLEKVLGSQFISYEESLYTDSAVVGNAPHHGHIKPYTTAETMDHGWCWNIPQIDEDHLGYVFSSRFCDTEQATVEFQTKKPGVHDLWTVRFRSGRHQDFVKGNVAAIGNSYGFVEPLESTAIFVICRECLLLARHLESITRDGSIKQSLNTTVSSVWDYIRWFLSIHYRFNDRSMTPFWRECRSSVAIDGAMTILDRYQRAAPLIYSQESFGFAGGPNFDAFGYDSLLFGQGVPANYLPPRQDDVEYADYQQQIQFLVAKAIPQQDALNVITRGKPELLYDSLNTDSWVNRMADAMQAACV